MPVATKVFSLICLYAEKRFKDGVHLTWSDGMYRLGAVIQALTGLNIRETDGVITALQYSRVMIIKIMG